MAAISFLLNSPSHLSTNRRLPFSPDRRQPSAPFSLSATGGNNNNSNSPRFTGGNGNGNGHNNGNNNSNNSNDDDNSSSNNFSNPFSLLIEGWRSRVRADPQFPFKVLMEELVGVSACVLGDMSSRPNFGLNELDFVFSTLVVGSILNFVLMYLLAPTSAVSVSVASALPSHMFEPGAYSLTDRFATLLYKGAVFAAVGFAAGLGGTAISNGLIAMRKRLDPEFETPNKPPPTLLNAGTWALHMGISSNLRYQSLNGIEFLMERVMPPAGFKVSVLVLRCLNNVLGGMSFVLLARLTGSQKVEEKGDVKERLIGSAVVAEVTGDGGELQRSGASK